jgi:hypothetical protein
MERSPPTWIPLSLSAVSAAVLWPYRHFAGDDAYITFCFVRNVANGTGYSFNPGEPTYGSTAPLWVFLVAGVHKLGLSIPDAAHALNWFFSILCVWAFWRLSTSYEERPLLQCLAGVLFVVNPWFVRWAMSGMENSLALFLWLATMISRLRHADGARVDWRTFVLAGASVLVRPEMSVFVCILFAEGAFRERKDWLDALARMTGEAALCLAVLAPWLAYARIHFGTVIPNTITAKVSHDHLGSLRSTGYFLVSFWAFQLIAFVGAVILRLRGRALRAAMAPLVERRWFLLIAWAVALPAFYVAGGAPVAGRYLVYAAPAFVLLGVRAWGYLLERSDEDGPLRRAIARSVVGSTAVATIALVAVVHYKYCWFVTRWAEGMDPQMVAIARYARDHSNKEDVIACDQIGTMGFFAERRILDLLSLVSPETLPYRRASDPNAIWRYVRSRSPQLLFLTDDIPLMVSRDPGYATAELLQEAHVYREGASAAGSVSTFRLYRTHWGPQAARDASR